MTAPDALIARPALSLRRDTHLHVLQERRRRRELLSRVGDGVLLVGVPLAFAAFFLAIGQPLLPSLGVGVAVALAGYGVQLFKRDLDKADLAELDESIALLSEPDRK